MRTTPKTDFLNGIAPYETIHGITPTISSAILFQSLRSHTRGDMESCLRLELWEEGQLAIRNLLNYSAYIYAPQKDDQHLQAYQLCTVTLLLVRRHRPTVFEYRRRKRTFSGICHSYNTCTISIGIINMERKEKRLQGWVRSHIGIEGNDEAAKKEITDPEG